MFRAKPWICIVALVSSATACSSSSSSSSSSTTQLAKQTQIVPTTLDGAAKARNESYVKTLMDYTFRTIDVTMPSVTGNEMPATLIANLSVYRERINDIAVKEDDYVGYGYNINMNSLRNYLSELVQLVDAFLNDVVYSSQNATAVSGGKLQYHLNKFEALKQCYMDLREDC